MHAPLTAPAREAACLKEIQALVECHERGFMARLGGQCNASRDALNQCLRQERLDRTAKNNEDAKLRNEKKRKAWESLKEDN